MHQLTLLFAPHPRTRTHTGAAAHFNKAGHAACRLAYFPKVVSTLPQLARIGYSSCFILLWGEKHIYLCGLVAVTIDTGNFCCWGRKTPRPEQTTAWASHGFFRKHTGRLQSVLNFYLMKWMLNKWICCAALMRFLWKVFLCLACESTVGGNTVDAVKPLRWV